MHLIVASTPYADWHRLRPLFEQTMCRFADDEAIKQWRVGMGVNPVENIELFRENSEKLLNTLEGPAILSIGYDVTAELLSAWVEEFDDTALMLFHTHPINALVKAILEDREESDNALEAWQDSATQILRVNRHHRSRVGIVDVDSALAAPADFLQVCQDHFSLKIANSEAIDSNEVQNEEVSKDEEYRFMATEMINQAQNIHELINELEASSLPIGEPVQKLNMNNEKSFQDIQKITSMPSEKLEQENELLLLQLHQAQEELISYYQELQKEIEKRKRVEGKLAANEQQIERIKTSISWKLTVPLRALRKSFINKLK